MYLDVKDTLLRESSPQWKFLTPFSKEDHSTRKECFTGKMNTFSKGLNLKGKRGSKFFSLKLSPFLERRQILSDMSDLPFSVSSHLKLNILMLLCCCFLFSLISLWTHVMAFQWKTYVVHFIICLHGYKYLMCVDKK